MIDLSNHIARRQIVSCIEADLDAYCREDMQDEPREHLGASVIGEPCSAKLWNDFRWLKQEKFTGQQLRLFNRGKNEEPLFVKYLRGIGFDVREYAKDEIEKHERQYRMGGCNGHFGGSLDAIVYAPRHYEISEPLIAEFKTHGEDSFAKLAGKKLPWSELRLGKRRTGGEGVRVSKPLHYAQMCSYGRAYGYRFGLYLAVNKNTDEIYPEIVELDWLYADDLFRKADVIVNSQTQPPKISQTKTFFQCKTCVHSGICFDAEKPAKNCRSCKFAVPAEDAKWRCTKEYVFRGILDKERIATGCDAWTAVING